MSALQLLGDAETEQTINVIDNLNAENAAIEQQRDAAVAEVASLKRKYEPDDGVLIDKILLLSDGHGIEFMEDHPGYGRQFMRVLVRTGENLLLQIVRNERDDGHMLNWEFRPPVDGTRGNMQGFSSYMYGVYEIYISYGTFGHDCLVHITRPACASPSTTGRKCR